MDVTMAKHAGTNDLVEILREWKNFGRSGYQSFE